MKLFIKAILMANIGLLYDLTDIFFDMCVEDDIYIAL